MNAVTSPRRTYDHRLRSIISEGGDPNLLADLAIPRSTVASWISRGPIEVVSTDDRGVVELQTEVLRLQRLVRILVSVVGLLKTLVRVSGFNMDHNRLPEGRTKAGVLAAIDRMVPVVALPTALRIAGLSPSRYHGWKRAERICGL